MHTGSTDEMEFDFETLDVQLRLFDSYKVGDIILVRSENAYVSRAYQWLCRSFLRGGAGPKWGAIPSHALIVVGPGLYMESMPKTGVRLIPAEECRPDQFQYFKVLRNSDADSLSEKIVDASTWHFGQAYNYKINLTWWRRKFHSHSYCSQLVCSIYEKAQEKLPGNPARIALPLDLAKLEFSSGWSEVTPQYIEAIELIDQGHAANMFETHRQLASYAIRQNEELADGQELIHRVHLITKMIDRRTRIRDKLARVSKKAAEAYHRRFISADNTSAGGDAHAFLTPEHCVDMLIAHVDEFTDAPDIFTRANSWRMTNERFQRQFEKNKAASTELMYRKALAFALAAFGLALHLRNGTEEDFELYRNRLLQATYISRELFVQLNEVGPKVFKTITALINEGNPSAKTWISAILCFMELTVVSRCLLPGRSFVDFCSNPRVSALGENWIGIFDSLPEEEKREILKLKRLFLVSLLNRPNVDIDLSEESSEARTQ